MNRVKHIFLVGAKSIGTYGGYETFINKLTQYHRNEERIQYHIACKANGQGAMNPYSTDGAEIINEKEFVLNNANCYRITVPETLGPAQAIYYDCKALEESIRIIKSHNIKDPIVYIMASRIGPFISRYYHDIHNLGGRVFLNPDGHEWKRAKWAAPIKKYWKMSEQLMVKYSDLVICDSINIERYIHESYDKRGIDGNNPHTCYIAYGAELGNSIADDEEWLKSHQISRNEYYLVVGRLVPENNYETIIREYMASSVHKDLIIICNENNKFHEELQRKTRFENDGRIKFVGTVYNEQLLKKIREDAYGYIHGHEVGGTNPSLLEALGSTKLNLLIDVCFNREVAQEAGLYWTKQSGSLQRLLDESEFKDREEIGKRAQERIRESYSWQYICDEYKKVFLG